MFQMNDVIWFTSISEKWYLKYGKEYLTTWQELPGEKICYVDEPIDNFVDCFTTVPTTVCLENTPEPEIYWKTYGTKRKSIKWYLKSRVTSYVLNTLKAKYLIWVDADVEYLGNLNLEEIFPNDDEVLSTIYKPEGLDSGFVCFNTHHPDFQKFVKEYESAWYNDMILESQHPGDAHILEILNRNYKYKNFFNGNVIRGRRHVDFFDTSIENSFIHHVGMAKEKS